MKASKTFSIELEQWLKGKGAKTFDELEKVFGERSFAVIFFVFMALPALPIPTGGITHVLEILVMLIALQPIIGFKNLWIPKFLAKRELPSGFVKKALPLLVGRVRWFEKYSRPRGSGLAGNKLFQQFAGLCVLGFTLAAFTAIPFSGMDTLPALGVVLIALAMIEGDIVFFVIGFLLGALGTVLNLTVGAALFSGIKHVLHRASPLQKAGIWGIIVLLILLLIEHHRSKKIK